MNILSLISIACLYVSTAQADTENFHVAQQRWVDGDYKGVISALESFLANPFTNSFEDLDSARFLLASAYGKRGDHTLSADTFAMVPRKSVLLKHALHREAVQRNKATDYKRAYQACKTLRNRWPLSSLANECLLIMATAEGALGNINRSQNLYKIYLKKFPKSSLREVIRLKQGIDLYNVSKERGVNALRKLYMNHRYPTTSQRITELLTPAQRQWKTTSELGDRIWSLMHNGRFDDSWDLVQIMQKRAQTDAVAKKWLSTHLRRISWKTRHFDAYADHMLEIYNRSPSAEIAWKVFRAYVRGGRWHDAVRWGRKSQKRYATSSRWSKAIDDLARAEMYILNYTKAEALWSQLGDRKANFYAGFSAYMAKNDRRAIQRFAALANQNDGWTVAAKYWSGRAKQRANKPIEAQQDFEYVKKHDRIGWYKQLVLGPGIDPNDPQWINRNGRWNGSRPLSEGAQAALELSNTFYWNIFSLDTPFITKISLFNQPKVELTPSALLGGLPTSYKTEVYGTKKQHKKLLLSTAKTHKLAFPQFLESYKLAQAAQYPEAARVMGKLYKERAVRPAPTFDDWRSHMLFTQAHHFVMRFTFGHSREPDKAKSTQIKRLNYPIVRAPEIWQHSQKYNIDPYLMHSILRQESTYKEFALSHVGAIGYVQVMPNTGARVAYLLEDPEYSPKDLENPAINLRYGIFYFSKLMERFDGAFPLAVGSYNGGPHNMSRWYKNMKGKVQMDEFVEHIAFDETRRYVKKVCGHYVQYVSLYAPQDAEVIIPLAPSKDDPMVIDF